MNQDVSLRSMTAYGRAKRGDSSASFVVELQSVNRRHLELRLSLPNRLNRFDPLLRERVGARLARGQVQLTVTADFSGSALQEVEVNEQLAAQYAAAYQKLSGSNEAPPWAWIMEQDGVLTLAEDDAAVAGLESILSEAVDAAIDQLIEMKRREGLALQRDLLGRVQAIRELREKVTGRSQAAVERYRTKLTERLADYINGKLDEDERLIKEIALFAEKVDVEEELTRLDSHLDQMEEILVGGEEVVGRTLEFIVQELNRETTTLGAKATDSEVGRWVVEIKGEIERIREQVQNVE